jgi:hypothetical protein
MAENPKEQSNFSSRLKNYPSLLLEYKLKTGIFFSLMATLASTEVMVTSMIGQGGFPCNPNDTNAFLTQALQEKYTHFTKGAVVGGIALALSLLVLIYLANRLRLLYKLKENLGGNQGFHFGEFSNSLHAFYKEYGIDPELYTLAERVLIEPPIVSQTVEGMTWTLKNRKPKVYYIGIPKQEAYSQDKKDAEIKEIFGEECKKKILSVGKMQGGKLEEVLDYRIMPISACDNLKDEWAATGSVHLHKQLVADLKKSLTINILIALASIEMTIASSLGQQAFPSAPNVVNSSLTHALHSGHAHFTVGTIIGMMGFLLSIVALIYLTKKLWNLPSPNIEVENSNSSTPTDYSPVST